VTGVLVVPALTAVSAMIRGLYWRLGDVPMVVVIVVVHVQMTHGRPKHYSG
jgi:hypothetical protein